MEGQRLRLLVTTPARTAKPPRLPRSSPAVSPRLTVAAAKEPGTSVADNRRMETGPFTKQRRNTKTLLHHGRRERRGSKTVLLAGLNKRIHEGELIPFPHLQLSPPGVRFSARMRAGEEKSDTATKPASPSAAASAMAVAPTPLAPTRRSQGAASRRGRRDECRGSAVLGAEAVTAYAEAMGGTSNSFGFYPVGLGRGKGRRKRDGEAQAMAAIEELDRAFRRSVALD